MTDKEMAEAYVRSRTVEAIREQIPYFEFAEQAYLEGLKKGREQARSQMMAELGDTMQTWR